MHAFPQQRQLRDTLFQEPFQRVRRQGIQSTLSVFSGIVGQETVNDLRRSFS